MGSSITSALILLPCRAISLHESGKQKGYVLVMDRMYEEKPTIQSALIGPV